MNAIRVVALVVCAALSLMPAREAAAKCRYVKLANLPIASDSRVPIVDGTINGKPAKMLLDTGSYTTLLTRAAVERFGLQTAHKSGETVGTAGSSRLYRAWVEEIALGNVKGGRGDFAVTWDSADVRPFDVLVGAEFLFQEDLEVELASSTVTFFHPLDCGDASLAYWSAETPWVPLPVISHRDQRRVVTVKVNGKAIRALVDTGASRSVIDIDAATRLGVTPASPGVEKSWLATFDSFEIGKERIEHPRIGVSDLWTAAKADLADPRQSRYLDEEPEMVLGGDFLRSHRVLFAVSQDRFYFTYLGGKVFGPADR